MPRRRRTTIAGYPNFVILLSNKSTPIFKDNLDKESFLNFLKNSKENSNKKMKLFAYVLMDKYIYIIVLPDKEDDISRLVQNLGRRYVRYYNLKYNQSGPLFESRFKNFVIGMNEHLLVSIRYLEAAPVRENIIASLEGYDWSSYNFRAYGKDRFGTLDYDPVYLASATTQEERQKNYRRIFAETEKGKEETLERLIYKGGIFADEKTKRFIEESLGFRLTPKNVGRPKRGAKDLEELSIKRKYYLRKGAFSLSLLMLDILIISILLYGANFFTLNLRNFLNIKHNPYIVPFSDYRWLPHLVIFIIASSFSSLGLYTNFVKSKNYEIFLQVGKAIVFVSLLLLSLIYITRSFNISRIFIVIFALLCLFILSLERILASKIYNRNQPRP